MQELTQEYKFGADEGRLAERGRGVLDGDPLLCNASMPLREIFYPLGFAVEIATNSKEVLVAARESWEALQQTYPDPPLRLRIGVTQEGPAECPPAPVVRAQRHLLSVVANGRNHAVCDLAEGFAFMWVSCGAVIHRSYFRYHFLESVALTLVATTRAVPIHAACVSRYGHGVLLCGASGAGKSTLAYGCARAGWTYTSDDASHLLCNSTGTRIIGNARQFRFRPSAKAIFPELQGRSLTPRARGKPSIEVPTSELGSIIATDEAEARFIIFLNRQSSAAPELRPLSSEFALDYFRQSVYPAQEIRQMQVAALEHLASLQVYELSYSDLAKAVSLLDRLARSAGTRTP